MVIGRLQSSLNREQGGQVATHLERFYNQVRAGMVEAQFRLSVAGLEQQIAHRRLVREAWDRIEPGGDRAEIASAESAETRDEQQSRQAPDWNG